MSNARLANLVLDQSQAIANAEGEDTVIALELTHGERAAGAYASLTQRKLEAVRFHHRAKMLYALDKFFLRCRHAYSLRL